MVLYVLKAEKPSASDERGGVLSSPTVFETLVFGVAREVPGDISAEEGIPGRWKWCPG